MYRIPQRSTDKHFGTEGALFGEAEELVLRFRKSRQNALCELILKRFERLILSIARRFARTGEPMDDLLQEGKLGLLRAIELYDVSKGMRFSTYAACRITTALEHYIRDRARPIRQPAWIQEQNHRVRRERERMRAVTGCDPKPEEIAERMQISQEEVEKMNVLTHQITLDSLDETVDEESGLTRGDCFSSPELDIPAEDRLMIENAARRLSQSESIIVDMIYYRQMTQREVALALGTSPSTVRRQLASALKRLRQEMTRCGYSTA